jgi:hypothetical protein
MLSSTGPPNATTFAPKPIVRLTMRALKALSERDCIGDTFGGGLRPASAKSRECQPSAVCYDRHWPGKLTTRSVGRSRMIAALVIQEEANVGLEQRMSSAICNAEQ